MTSNQIVMCDIRLNTKCTDIFIDSYWLQEKTDKLEQEFFNSEEKLCSGLDVE